MLLEGHIRYVAEQGKLLAQAWSDVAQELVQASLEDMPDVQEKICKKYRLNPNSNAPYFYAVSAFYRTLVQHGAFDKGTSDWSYQVGSTLDAILTARAHAKLIRGYLVHLPSRPGYQPFQQSLNPRILEDEHVLCEYLLRKLSSLVDVLWKEASELDVLARAVNMEIRRNQR